MAIDGKYGRVTTERGTIGDDEPVVVFRAQDALLVEVLDYYRDLCEQAGTEPSHLEAIDDATGAVERWRAEHATKLPDTP